jgi:hypothetical protein
MKREVVFSSRFGDRWTLAIEFEGIGERPRKWNEWWGSLWLWVNGRVVGSPSEIEVVMTGFDSLMESASQNINKLELWQSSAPAEQALEFAMWANYGTEDEAPADFCGNPEFLKTLEVLPGLTGPFFDGYKAVLLRAGQNERFIYQPDGEAIVEASWPAGTFRSVVLGAFEVFKKLATTE